MGRTQQMRRDLITVALIVSLLVAALLLTGSKEAFAQSAAEDQYSDPSSVPASPAPTSTPGSGGGLPQASQGASGGGPTSCNPSGSYGGLAGTPPGCEMGPDSTDIAGYGGSSTSNGDSGSMPIQGYITRYVPVAEQLASPSAPLMAGSQLAQLAASALSPHPTQPSDAQPSTIVPACSAAYTLSCLPPPQWPIL
jgi:hypothetical protein